MQIEVTREMMAGGDLLRHLVEHFKEEPSREHISLLLNCFRDSMLFIPVTIKENEEGKLEMLPDLLDSNGELFFPVFSRAEEMGSYGENFSKAERSFEEIAGYVKNDNRVSGIVLDAFSNYFVLSKEYIDIALSMPSRIVERKTQPKEKQK